MAEGLYRYFADWAALYPDLVEALGVEAADKAAAVINARLAALPGRADLAEVLGPHVPYRLLPELMETIFKGQLLVSRDTYIDALTDASRWAEYLSDELTVARRRIERLRTLVDLGSVGRAEEVLGIAIAARKTLATASKGWQAVDAIIQVLASAQELEHVDGDLVAVKEEPGPEADDPRLGPVVAWSIGIHGRDSERHAWCVAAARALLAGEAPPAAGPGTAFARRATAGQRLDTICRLLEPEPEPRAAMREEGQQP